MRPARTLPLPLLAAALFYAAPAQADYTICVVGRVQTIDSGKTIPRGPNAGDTEDYWSNADSGINKALQGIFVIVDPPQGADQGEWTDGDGCADFSGSVQNANVIIRSRTKRNGNHMILHGQPDTFSPTTSGWSYVFSNQNLNSNQTYTYQNIGSGIAKWTALFTANFTLDRWKNVTTGKYIHLGVDESCVASPPSARTDNRASAHYGPGSSASNSQITSGWHYLVLSNCSSTLLTRRKSIVSHEVGHALAALFYADSSSATNGDEPNCTDLNNDLDPARSPNSSACTGSSNSYSIYTKEWNSIAFREGFAHFVAAAAWSDKDDAGRAGSSGTGHEAEFTWFNDPQDLRRYNQGSGTNNGGRLENICCVEPGSNCSTSWDSAATNGDWMRFLWSYFTDDTCGSAPTKKEMLQIYQRTRLNGGLTKGNYYTRARTAMRQLVTSSCLRGRWDTWAMRTGVDNDT